MPRHRPSRLADRTTRTAIAGLVIASAAVVASSRRGTCAWPSFPRAIVRVGGGIASAPLSFRRIGLGHDTDDALVSVDNRQATDAVLDEQVRDILKWRVG